MTVRVEWETRERRMERCDHQGTTERVERMPTISACSACGKTWLARFGAGAPTVRIVSKLEGASGDAEIDLRRVYLHAAEEAERVRYETETIRVSQRSMVGQNDQAGRGRRPGVNP